MIEASIEHAANAVRYMDAHGVAAVEPTAEAQDAFNRDVDRMSEGTVWMAGCQSWYLDPAGRNAAVWPASVGAFRRRVAPFRPGEYHLRSLDGTLVTAAPDPPFSLAIRGAGARALSRLPEALVARLAGTPVVVDGQRLDPHVQLLLRLEARPEPVSRDLFQHDNGGWIEDVGLLDRLATERLTREAEAIGAEGWKWVEAALDFSYGHATGMRRVYGERPEVSDEEQAAHEALTDELECLYAAHEGDEDLPEEVDARLAELETAIDAFNNPPVTYDPAEVARAGVFVSIGSDGSLKVERGFVRPEDEAPITADPVGGGDGTREGDGNVGVAPSEPQRAVIMVGGAQPGADEPEEDDTLRPLSERLVTELTAHRTLALRDAVAIDPDSAHLAVLHALCLPVFYRFGFDSCLELTAKSSGLSTQAPGLADSASAKAIEARHDFWAKRLPEGSAELWPTLVSFGPDERQSLFAHVASQIVNVTREPFNRRPGAIAHGEVLARAVGLDLAQAGWRPTVDNYLGRVPKARILEAVREAKGEMAAQLIDHLKKPEMAKEAERLLAETGWVPEPLRVEGVEPEPAGEAGEVEALPDFLDQDEGADAELDPEPVAIAAE